MSDLYLNKISNQDSVPFIDSILNRTSTIVQTIEIPAENVLTVVFGGHDLSTLFVTTGTKVYNFLTGEISKRTFSDQSGSIFMVKNLGAKGYAGRKVSI